MGKAFYPPLCIQCEKDILQRAHTFTCQCTEVAIAKVLEEEECPDHWPLVDMLEYYTDRYEQR